MKDAETRLRETIDFIRAHPVPTFVGDFKLIIQALNAWHITAPSTTRQKLSLLMSQAKAVNRPQNKTDRAYRRACILLKCALVEPETQWDTKAGLINTGVWKDFAEHYQTELEISRDKLYSSPGLARQNLLMLQTETRKFMKEYKLLVNGKPQGQKFTYGFYMENGIYCLDCILLFKARFTVDAINVPATPFTQVQNSLGNIQATLSSVDSTCNLMLTTQFTGCCYCFMVNGTDLAAAHIDPQGLVTGITGQHISQQLRANGGFSNGNGGTFKAYGRVDDGSNLYGYPQSAQQMIIVAVKRASGWRVYAQIDVGGHLSAKRID